jgi:hypothetical protein
MRTIQVSADLYAAIWKQQQPGEASEEVILRRILKVQGIEEPLAAPSEPPSLLHAAGLYDRRNDVWFPAGFEVFRTYRGQEYRAQVIGNLWYRVDTRGVYPSLNKLSDSIGASENAWDGWLYHDETTGDVKPISKLRDPSRVRQRLARSTDLSPEETGL